MNLFVWGSLADRENLSFVLRRPYKEKLIPCTLKEYMQGKNYTDMLFKSQLAEIEGNMSTHLDMTDFNFLDMFHATEEEIHDRVLLPVLTLNNGFLVEFFCEVYVAGSKFSKIKEGLFK